MGPKALKIKHKSSDGFFLMFRADVTKWIVNEMLSQLHWRNFILCVGAHLIANIFKSNLT